MDMKPAGLLENLRSKEEVPEKEADRMHVRDTVKVAMVGNRPQNFASRTTFALGKGSKRE